MPTDPINPLPLGKFAPFQVGDISAYVAKVNEFLGREIEGLTAGLVRQAKVHTIASEILQAASRAVAKHGNQSHLPDGTGPDEQPYQVIAEFDSLADWEDVCRDITDEAANTGSVTWRDIFLEEVAEALAQDDLQALRSELLDTGAVIVNWIEAIDQRIEE